MELNFNTFKEVFKQEPTEADCKICTKISKLNDLQAKKLKDFAEHYFDTDDMEFASYNTLSYYQIIEDCLRIIKEKDINARPKIGFDKKNNI